MKNVFFGLIKNNKYVLHQSSSRKLWEDFIDRKSTKIPDEVIADANDFLYHFENGLTVEDCSECHFWDFENNIEKICTNLSEKVLKWETKSKGEINK